MIAIILASLSTAAATALFLLLRRSLQREEKLKQTLIVLSTAVQNVYQEMLEVDSLGWFREDDEVGSTFENLLQLVTILQQIVVVEDTEQEDAIVKGEEEV